MDIQTSTKLDKYNPNVRKNDIRRHIKSPAVQVTVTAQPVIGRRTNFFICTLHYNQVLFLPISNGISMNVTSKSARAKCINIVSILLGFLSLRRVSKIKTVQLPTDDTTIRIL